MKNGIWIVVLGLTVSLSACTPSGSSSTDKTQQSESQSDSQTAAGQQSAPVPQSEEPILAEVPDAPTPEPMGWSTFDAYFKQLQVVYDHVLTDSIPQAEAKQLYQTAEALAKDKTVANENSEPMRLVLAEQTKRFMERSGDQVNKLHWMEMFPMILFQTREVVQTRQIDQNRGYPEKLESMRVSVENKLLKLRFKQQ